MDTNLNTCTRCGKIRKIVKTWKEKVQTYNGLTEIICSQAVCPDADCQQRVDAEIAAKRLKSEEIEQSRKNSKNAKKVSIQISSQA